MGWSGREKNILQVRTEKRKETKKINDSLLISAYESRNRYTYVDDPRYDHLILIINILQTPWPRYIEYYVHTLIISIDEGSMEQDENPRTYSKIG
jgi:hypothetical protein